MIAGIMSIAVLMIGIIQSGGANVQAATPKWKIEYSKILNNWELAKKYQDTTYLQRNYGKRYKFDRYYTYDVDKNGIPELFLYSTTMKLTHVFTYNQKLISCGYDDFTRINKKEKELIMHGHWHGSGGSGSSEWSIYKLNSRGMSRSYYIDIFNGRTVVYNASGKLISTKKNDYDKIYNAHIKNSTNLNFKKYRLSNKAGLKK